MYTWGKTQVEKKTQFLEKTQVPKIKKMTKSSNFRPKKAKTQTNFEELRSKDKKSYLDRKTGRKKGVLKKAWLQR